ncbi:hypothetical protein GCM10027037_28840 [Mucilaginibacter koreensis]
MANQQENQQKPEGNQPQYDNDIGGVNVNQPDPKTQNNTGYAGTTNAVSENHQESDSYQIAPEDTMIGYNGNDEQMNMDLGDKDKLRSGKSGVDDND